MGLHMNIVTNTVVIPSMETNATIAQMAWRVRLPRIKCRKVAAMEILVAVIATA